MTTHGERPRCGAARIDRPPCRAVLHLDQDGRCPCHGVGKGRGRRLDDDRAQLTARTGRHAAKRSRVRDEREAAAEARVDALVGRLPARPALARAPTRCTGFARSGRRCRALTNLDDFGRCRHHPRNYPDDARVEAGSARHGPRTADEAGAQRAHTPRRRRVTSAEPRRALHHRTDRPVAPPCSHQDGAPHRA